MILTAYYLNGSLFSIVPRHIEEDFRWMADHGTNAVAISAYERDLKRERTWDLFCRTAEKTGLKVYIVPSRWAGLVAGWPGAPSRFTATHPETWILDEQQRPRVEGSWGLCSSVHHPATEEFYRNCLDTILRHPIAGIIWDEVKILQKADFSPMAMSKIPSEAGMDRHVQAAVDFFDRVTQYARKLQPELVATMFLYATMEQRTVDACAKMPSLDYFGLDGKPWPREEAGRLKIDTNENVLIPHAQRFFRSARSNGKGGFMLIENMGMPRGAHELVDRYMPEVLAYRPEHLAYYYYGADVEEPERMMQLLGRHFREAT
jgi:hypothetical protein